MSIRARGGPEAKRPKVRPINSTVSRASPHAQSPTVRHLVIVLIIQHRLTFQKILFIFIIFFFFHFVSFFVIMATAHPSDV